MPGKSLYGIRLIRRLVADIRPEVDRRLDLYRELARQAGDAELARQALASLAGKRFHALGGSVYALYPGAHRTDAVCFITAFQTISDYLDNLCDRAGIYDEQAFRQLHLSMLEAADPAAALSDYYLYYPYKYDNGYLTTLVTDCHTVLKKAPSYSLVKDAVIKLVSLYTDLQAYKHLDPDIREKKTAEWAGSCLADWRDISCWEFAAAAGSTLGIFVLLAASFDPGLTETEVERLHSEYFPWITGLHILLDYFIDSEEDRECGDLNFTHYYKDLEQCQQRMILFVRQSAQKASRLRYPEFHMTIVRGLLAMYLSDPKARDGRSAPVARRLMKEGGFKTQIYYLLCRLLRRAGKL